MLIYAVGLIKITRKELKEREEEKKVSRNAWGLAMWTERDWSEEEFNIYHKVMIHFLYIFCVSESVMIEIRKKEKVDYNVTNNNCNHNKAIHCKIIFFFLSALF